MALDWLQAAIQTCANKQNEPWPEMRGWLFGLKGEAHTRLADFHEAINCFETALRTIGPGHRREAVRIRSSLALALMNTPGRVAEGRRMIEEAVSDARDVGDTRGLALQLTNLATLCVRTGNCEDALRHAEESLRTAVAVGDTEGELGALTVQASALSGQGRFRETFPIYDRAIFLARELHLRPAIGRLQNDVGMTYLLDGRFDNASSCFEEALACAEKTGDKVPSSWLFRTWHW